MSATQAKRAPPDDRCDVTEAPRWYPVALALATIAAGTALVAVVPWLAYRRSDLKT